MSVANCCVLLKDTSFNYNQYEENNDGSQLLQLPREVISIIGRFVAQGPNGIRDASQWGSVCVLTHQLWHKDQEDCQALETIWKKMPVWCRFAEHIEHDGYGGSWGGGRPTKAMGIRYWFEDFRYDHQRAQVEELYLLNLNLSSLPPEMEKLPRLSYINLSDNQLPCIPKVLRACPNLTRIILNNNNITMIPGWLTKKCPKLQWVELLNNPVSNQPSPNDIFVLQ